MMTFKNLKNLAKHRVVVLALPTLLILSHHPPAPVFEESSSAIEKMRFYDWQIDISSEQGTQECSIRFTGFSQKKMLLSMTLSLVKGLPLSGDPHALTIIRISVAHVTANNFSDPVSIAITDGWIETWSETSLGKTKDINVGSAPHFLGGKEGSGLFLGLLRGFQKDGIFIGYRSGNDRHISKFQISPPPPSVLEALHPCYTEKASFTPISEP